MTCCVFCFFSSSLTFFFLLGIWHSCPSSLKDHRISPWSTDLTLPHWQPDLHPDLVWGHSPSPCLPGSGSSHSMSGADTQTAPPAHGYPRSLTSLSGSEDLCKDTVPHIHGCQHLLGLKIQPVAIYQTNGSWVKTLQGLLLLALSSN